MVARALAWLEASVRDDARPWFVWVHLLEPHSPYEPGPELEAKYLPADAPVIGDDLRSEVFGESIERTPAEVELIRALYRGEVEATDRALAPLLGWVESHRKGGAREQHGEILSVFTADHGELLYEHERYVGHTAWLWEEMLRVPLWLHFTSGREQAQRSTFPASLLDIAPTVLPALGVPFESVDGGRDLLQSDMGGERMLVHSTFSPEGHYDQYALRFGADKLHLASERPGSVDRMYDIDADLEEQFDVSAERLPRSAELRALWERWRAQQDDPRAHRDPLIDSELRRQLEALGYSQGSLPPERGEDG